MNPLKSFVFVFLRGYARKSHRHIKQSEPSTHDQIRISRNMTEKELYPNINEDEINFEDDDHDYDVNAAESDFSTAGRSYREYIRDRNLSKEVLKKRIIARKYFKPNDPVFITWTEKQQIQTLHEANSLEWTPERLSESFPALPETIRKILKSKWLPKSTESVIKHDKVVIDNWKKFKTGSIAVDPILENHLNKFKDRKMDLTNLASLAENLVKPPPVFPTPKCQIFSEVIQNYIGNTSQNKKKNDKKPRKIAAKNQAPDPIKKLIKTHENIDRKHVTFDTFLNKKVEDIVDKNDLSLENELLVEEYKQKKNIDTLENNKEALQLPVSQPKKKLPCALSTESSPIESSNTPVKISRIDINTSSIDTGILDWKKKGTSGEIDYPNFIKVPQAKAKKGVTFKVQDRYYDSDGEFLYRVTGLKT